MNDNPINMKSLRVADIMTKEVIFVSPHDNLMSVKKIFEAKKIHHLPVLQEGMLVGVVSNTDFERSKYGKSLFVTHDADEHNDTLLNVTLVGMVMTEKVETISADDTVHDAYLKFKQNTFRSLPVMLGEMLIGILTPMDLLDFYFEQE